uniref:Uncharacterized protein n=1 Tax=Sinocyclocheilus grahami TaxID=75366 RepID=A0A672SGT2_SINGR
QNHLVTGLNQQVCQLVRAGVEFPLFPWAWPGHLQAHFHLSQQTHGTSLAPVTLFQKSNST